MESAAPGTATGTSDAGLIFYDMVLAAANIITLHYDIVIGAICMAFCMVKAAAYLGFGKNRALRLTTRYEPPQYTTDAAGLELDTDTELQPHTYFHQHVSVFNRPVFCNVCRQIMMNKALSCGVCLFSCHQRCVQRASRTCKYMTVAQNCVTAPEYASFLSTGDTNSDDNSNNNQHDDDNNENDNDSSSDNNNSDHQDKNNNNNNNTNGSADTTSSSSISNPLDQQAHVQYAFEHQWQRGNLSTVKHLCVICQDSVGSLLGLSPGYNCLWCQRKIHIHCMKNLHTQVCDRGEFANLIVSPTCVHLLTADHEDRHNNNTNNTNNNNKNTPPKQPTTLHGRVPSESIATTSNAAATATAIATATRSGGGKKGSFGLRRRMKKLFRRRGSSSGHRRGNGQLLSTVWQVHIPKHVFPHLCPLLVFVNPKSGGGAGAHLLRSFKALLHPLQVFDLTATKDGAITGLTVWKATKCHVLACGGDGTVAWVLAGIDQVYGVDSGSSNGRPEVSVLSTPTKQKQPPVEQKRKRLPDEEGGGESHNPTHGTTPAVAVLPLGTGNDLARSLNWGGGFEIGSQDLEDALRRILHAHMSLLDRWNVHYTPHLSSQNTQNDRKHNNNNNNNNTNTKETDPKRQDGVSNKNTAGQFKTVMNAYLGIGFDAEIARKFHDMREANPSQFQSQLNNKAWYAKLGAEAYFFPDMKGSEQLNGVKITVDGRDLDLTGLQGVLVLNVPCYGGGSDLWGRSAPIPRLIDQFDEVQEQLVDVVNSGVSTTKKKKRVKRRVITPSMCDRRVEVVGIRSSLHMGVIQIGLARSIRMDQGYSVTITTSRPTNIQVDGEPVRLQGAGSLECTFRNQAFILEPTTREEHQAIKQITTVLNWAEDTEVITREQRETLLKAFVQQSTDLDNHNTSTSKQDDPSKSHYSILE